MSIYLKLKKVLKKDLQRLELTLEETLKSQDSYLSENEKEMYRRGKRIRPMLLYLCTRLNLDLPLEEPLEEKVIKGAVSLEMLHVASLIHDDIIDNADVRRGVATVNATRGNELALLIGDLQFIESVRVMSDTTTEKEDIDHMREYIQTAHTLCRGQIDELLTEITPDIETLKKRYFRTIDRKTGRLIAFACESGAWIARKSRADVLAMRRFGMYLGRVFQIMDDILDVLNDAEASGKTLLKDIVQKRLTLPVLHLLEITPNDHLIWQIYRGNKPPTQQDLNQIADEFRNMNAVIMSHNEVVASLEAAKDCLEFTPNNIYKDLLIELADGIAYQGFANSKNKKKDWILQI
jgi:heptaprenyl diphosphate synthase